jgi:hypothetical protein
MTVPMIASSVVRTDTAGLEANMTARVSRVVPDPIQSDSGGGPPGSSCIDSARSGINPPNTQYFYHSLAFFAVFFAVLPRKLPVCTIAPLSLPTCREQE